MPLASWSFGSRAASAAVALALFLGAVPARADKIAEAEDLFRRAKALMNDKRYDEACPMLAESYRSDPALGTLLNLALCHEQIGKTATAWGEFRSAEQQARSAVPPRPDRVDLAREHAEKLEPRLSRIRIVVPSEARAPGLVLEVDGEAKGEPLWSGIPVDPGTRVVEARATGKKPVVIKVKIDDEGVLRTVTIPVLADAPVATATPGAAGPDLRELEEYASNRARRTTGFVIGGFGLATLAAGAAFGVAAIVNDNEAKECGSPCYEGTPEGQASDRATDRALVFANIANVTVPLGIIGTAVGAFLVLGAGPSSRPAGAGGGLSRPAARAGGARASVAPALAPAAVRGGAGLSLTGLW